MSHTHEPIVFPVRCKPVKLLVTLMYDLCFTTVVIMYTAYVFPSRGTVNSNDPEDPFVRLPIPF